MKKMNGIWISPIAVAVGLSLAGLAFAEQPGSQPHSGKPMSTLEKPEAAREAMGEVVKADPAKLSLVIKAGGKELTFTVAEQAAKALVTLKPGDKVLLQYTEAHGMRTVQEIRKG